MFCDLFGYSKQAFYKQRKYLRKKELNGFRVKEMVLSVRGQMPRLGTRKLHYLRRSEFEKCGIKLGRDGLFSLLRAEGLLIRKIRRYTKTTNSKHWLRKYTNLIKDLEVNRPPTLHILIL